MKTFFIHYTHKYVVEFNIYTYTYIYKYYIQVFRLYVNVSSEHLFQHYMLITCSIIKYLIE